MATYGQMERYAAQQNALIKEQAKRIEDLYRIRDLVFDFFSIVVNKSEGVCGFYLNGQVAKWDELSVIEGLRGALKNDSVNKEE